MAERNSGSGSVLVAESNGRTVLAVRERDGLVLFKFGRDV